MNPEFQQALDDINCILDPKVAIIEEEVEEGDVGGIFSYEQDEFVLKQQVFGKNWDYYSMYKNHFPSCLVKDVVKIICEFWNPVFVLTRDRHNGDLNRLDINNLNIYEIARLGDFWVLGPPGGHIEFRDLVLRFPENVEADTGLTRLQIFNYLLEKYTRK